MTRAPRSASWRVANGAAMACSTETTVMPSSGRTSRTLPLLDCGPRDAGAAPAPVDHQRPPERDHDRPVLVEPGGPAGHDADVRPRARLSLLQDLGAGVDRVALEHGRRQPHLVPAQIGEHVLRHVGHALAGHESERERRVDQRSLELRLRRVVAVEVDRRAVLGQQREPDVVGVEDGPAQRVLVHVAGLEVLVEPPAPPLLDGHAITCTDIDGIVKRVASDAWTPAPTFAEYPAMPERTSIDRLLQPRTVAIVGLSDNSTRLLEGLGRTFESDCEIFIVNPRYERES